MKKQKNEPAWCHAGGKLWELGADTLTDAELLSIFIGTGTKGKTAEDIAKEILDKFQGFKGMEKQTFEKVLQFKGIGKVKVVRMAAAFEFARRVVQEVLKRYEPSKEGR